MAFDSEDEFGMFYGGFELPPHLLWCDLEVLMQFPMKSSSEDVWRRRIFLHDDRFESQILGTFFVTEPDVCFDRGLSCVLNRAAERVHCCGISVAALTELATVLGLESTLVPCYALSIDLVVGLERRFVSELACLREEDIDALVDDWFTLTIAAYRDDSAMCRATKGRSIYSDGMWMYAGRPADGLNHDSFESALLDLVELCRARRGMQKVYFAATY